jgi:hypothetical protein
MIIGYTVVAHSRKLQCEWEPLCFGMSDEPSPAMLLRRNRYDLFATEQVARDALQETLRAAVAEGLDWPTKCRFMVKPVQSAGAWEAQS